MRTARLPYVAILSALAGSLLVAAPARAATPPGDWSLAVERLFGITRTSIDSDVGDSTYTSISLLSKVVGGYGYSAPRFAFDYLIGSGVSFGGALGYNSLGDGDGDAWLIAPRVGYFARPGRSFGLWPRVGLTQLVVDYGDSDTATALTLELPLEFFVSSGVAFTLTPHADIGIGGSENDVDRTVTELGLQFGVGLFL
jgi:hypothetical protein